MSKSLSGRLDTLETMRATLKGWRTFATCDGESFVETTPERPGVARNYRQSIPDPDGNFAPELPTISRAQLDDIEGHGWLCIVVRWVDKLDTTSFTPAPAPAA